MSRVATEYSVNPRLLLAVLEYQSGWVTESSPASETMVYPMRVYEDYREGLYSQLCWAASFLNEGFYQWAIEAISIWTLTDSTVVEVDPTINAGTAGVLNLMSNLTTAETWARRPLKPAFTNLRVALWQPIRLCCGTAVAGNLTQPTLQLPFEVGDVWAYTSGPHSGWDAGSAWAALDLHRRMMWAAMPVHFGWRLWLPVRWCIPAMAWSFRIWMAMASGRMAGRSSICTLAAGNEWKLEPIWKPVTGWGMPLARVVSPPVRIYT